MVGLFKGLLPLLLLLLLQWTEGWTHQRTSLDDTCNWTASPSDPWYFVAYQNSNKPHNEILLTTSRAFRGKLLQGLSVRFFPGAQRTTFIPKKATNKRAPFPPSDLRTSLRKEKKKSHCEGQSHLHGLTFSPKKPRSILLRQNVFCFLRDADGKRQTNTCCPM